MNQQRSSGGRFPRGQAANRRGRRGLPFTTSLSGHNPNLTSAAQRVLEMMAPPHHKRPKQVPYHQQMHLLSLGKSFEEKLAPIMRHTAFPRDFVRSVLVPAMPSEKAGILMAGVLLSAARRKGPAEIGDLWIKSELKWTQFLKYYSSVDDFIKKHKLEFTLAPEVVKIPIKSPPKVEPPPKKKEEESEQDREVRLNLERLLQGNESNEQIFHWIDANVENKEATFIRTLVSEVLKTAIDVSKQPYKLDKNKLDSRMPLLSLYIAHDEDLELQALFAVQSLSHKLGLYGLLRQIFQTIYDGDVISEDSFVLWRSSHDPKESLGKQMADFFTTSFFSWLKATESSSDEFEY